jgi:hypothetical protein
VLYRDESTELLEELSRRHRHKDERQGECIRAICLDHLQHPRCLGNSVDYHHSSSWMLSTWCFLTMPPIQHVMVTWLCSSLACFPGVKFFESPENHTCPCMDCFFGQGHVH